MKTLRAMPVLNVSDVRASAAFYERAGVSCHGFWGEDPVDFAIVQRGDVTIGLHYADGPVPSARGWSAYLYVSDIEALHEELTGEGLNPSPICDQPYGCRDFDITDPDGHDVAFGQDVHPHDNGPGMGPERGRG